MCHLKPLLSIALLGMLLGTQATAQALELSLPMQQASSGNFYIHATLNDRVESDFLLDTGSGYVSLSAKTFNKLKTDSATVFQRNITGIMANGKALSVPVYQIAELRLTPNCVLRDIEVAVFPHADRDILGLNALKRLQPFTMQMDPPMLTGSQCA
ncbi:MAG: hypothetical protein COC05_00780 [Gammaproteobacteria bacterium]|nr:MAG: hypothetical protein COC05_00780 [Gammaproteobacteria bacterium]